MLFDIDKNNKAIVKGDEFARMREKFSVENEAAKFGRYRGKFMPYRKYIITPAGKFDVGMYFEFKKYLNENYEDVKVVKSEKFTKVLYPRIAESMPLADLKLVLRDYQKDIVTRCNRVGRGVVVLATAGGKTLTMASLIQTSYDHVEDKSQFRCLVLVPDLGLVNQTYTEFKEYGVKFTFSKWTGSDDLDLSTNIIICNMGILQSKKTDTSFLSVIDMLVVDEVHKLRTGNKINKIFKLLTTNNRFGFTGTMPEKLEDQWNIIGKIGPILYEKNSYQLREEDYIAKAKVYVIKILYDNHRQYMYDGVDFDPTAKYRHELNTLQQSTYRNNVISKVCGNIDNNALLLVDYIEHGQLLYNTLSLKLKNKQVYFIRGEVEVSERDKIKQLMEGRNDVICIAISKIFSTGINIKNLHYIMFCAGGKAKVKIIQSIGRGLRQHKSKSMLTIIDIADQLHYGKQHMHKRLKLYEQEKFDYKFQTLTCDE
jgi:superfamily II DNA or RNA helicase